MRKPKGLLLIATGLLVLGVWLFPFVYVYYAIGPPEAPEMPLILLILRSAYGAFTILINPFIWTPAAAAISLVGITGFALLFSGLYRLVCSLLPSQWNDEEEE